MSKIPLNEFITLQRGYDLPNNKRIIGKIPVVASTGIVGFHNQAKVNAPGVVIGRSGSIGGGQYITENFFPLNTTLYVKDFKGHYPRFIYYLLKNIDFETFNVGSGVPTLNRNHLSGILIKDLGIENEKRIAKILGDLDDKIHLNTQTNQTLEQIAQALYKSWFVDFEPTRAKAAVLAAGGSAADAETAAMAALSGQTPAALAALARQNPARHQQLATLAAAFPSALVSIDGYGEVPQGWEVKKVGDIAKIVKGKKPKNVYPSQENNLLPHILVAALGGRYVEFCKIEKMAISEITDTLVLMDGSASGKVAIGHHGVVGSTLAKMELSNRKYWAILHQFLKMKERDIQDNTTGTSIPHADKARINNYSLIVCDGFILDYYNQLFENTLFQSIHNRKQNHLLENIRDTLLPKLLSGELPHALG